MTIARLKRRGDGSLAKSLTWRYHCKSQDLGIRRIKNPLLLLTNWRCYLFQNDWTKYLNWHKFCWTNPIINTHNFSFRPLGQRSWSQVSSTAFSADDGSWSGSIIPRMLNSIQQWIVYMIKRVLYRTQNPGNDATTSGSSGAVIRGKRSGRHLLSRPLPKRSKAKVVSIDYWICPAEFMPIYLHSYNNAYIYWNLWIFYLHFMQEIS